MCLKDLPESVFSYLRSTLSLRWGRVHRKEMILKCRIKPVVEWVVLACWLAIAVCHSNLGDTLSRFGWIRVCIKQRHVHHLLRQFSAYPITLRTAHPNWASCYYRTSRRLVGQVPDKNAPKLTRCAHIIWLKTALVSSATLFHPFSEVMFFTVTVRHYQKHSSCRLQAAVEWIQQRS